MNNGKRKNTKEKGISIKVLKERIKKCEKERDEHLLGWKRARADFINYKKEEAEQFENRIRRGKESLVQELILILDSFDLCIFSSKNDAVEKEGVKLIQNQLYDTLRKNGIERIEVKPGENLIPIFTKQLKGLNPSKFRIQSLKKLKKGIFLKAKFSDHQRLKSLSKLTINN